MLVTIPLIRTELAKCDFVIQASKLWNALIGKSMNECRPNSIGIMIQVQPIALTYQLLYQPERKNGEIFFYLYKNWIQLINSAGENRMSGILKTSLNLKNSTLINFYLLYPSYNDFSL